MEPTRELRTVEKYASEVKEAIASCESIHWFSDKLVDKDFISRQGQSDIIYNTSLPPREKAGQLVDAVLFQVKYNPSTFETFVEVLEEQSPLKPLATRLKEDHSQPDEDVSFSRQSSQSTSESSESLSEFSVSSLESQWALLIVALIEILSNHQKALWKMKQALQQRVTCKPTKRLDEKLKKKFAPLLASPKYEEAATVDAFFALLAPFWNWKEYSLLEFLVKASGSKSAMEKLREFIQIRGQAAPHIFLQRSDTVEGNPNQPISTVPLLTPSGESTYTSEDQPAVIALMKVNKDELTLEDYDKNTFLLCRVAGLPRYSLTLQDIRTGCIAIRWQISSDLAEIVEHRVPPQKLLQELAQQGVLHISIGNSYQLSVATMGYWKHKQSIQLPVDIFLEIFQGKLDAVRQWLEEGVSMNIRNELGSTPLMVATWYGCQEIAELLLEYNQDVNAQNEDGWNALMCASRNGYREIAQLLIEHNSEVNVQNKNGWNALMWASIYGFREITQLLVKHNADVNVQKEDGCSAIMLASGNGHREIAQLLIEHNSDINVQNKDGWSALMVASGNGHREVAQVLIEHNADINAQNKDGWSAIMLASSFGHRETVQLLIKHNANINVQGMNGFTALMLASEGGHTEIVLLLLDQLAEINIQSTDGMTALDLASVNECPELYQILELNGAVHGTPYQLEVSEPHPQPPPDSRRPIQQLRELINRQDDLPGLVYHHDPPLRDTAIPPDQWQYDPTTEQRFGGPDQYT